MYLLIGNRIVGFGIDNIQQRSDLRKFSGNKIHHGLYPFGIVFEKNNDKHNFSCRRRANDDIAHKSCLFAQVKEQIVVIDSKFLDGQSYTIGYIVL